MWGILVRKNMFSRLSKIEFMTLEFAYDFWSVYLANIGIKEHVGHQKVV